MSAPSFTNPITRVPFSSKGSSKDDFVFGPEGNGDYSLTVGEILQAIENAKKRADIMSEISETISRIFIDAKPDDAKSYSLSILQSALTDIFSTQKEKKSLHYFGEPVADLICWHLIQESELERRLVQQGYVVWADVAPSASEWHAEWRRLKGIPVTVSDAARIMDEWDKKAREAGAKTFENFGGGDKE